MGPVESIASDGLASTVVVLGQVFSIEDLSPDLVVGDYVVAASHPSLGTTVYPVGVSYVAGVSTVKVKATATAVSCCRDCVAGQHLG